MIITTAYFKGSIHIDNATDVAPNSDLLGNTTELNEFIQEFVPECLIMVLGYSLFNELQNELDPQQANGLKDTAHQKWNDLLNGKEYQIDGVTVKWNGLIYSQANIKRSLLADYVYFKYMENEKASMQENEVNNAIVTSAFPKVVKAWRRFHSLVIGSFNSPTRIHSKHGYGIDWLNTNNGLRSLYQFIQDVNNIDPTTYENWTPTSFENLNNFDI